MMVIGLCFLSGSDLVNPESDNSKDFHVDGRNEANNLGVAEKLIWLKNVLGEISMDTKETIVIPIIPAIAHNMGLKLNYGDKNVLEDLPNMNNDGIMVSNLKNVDEEIIEMNSENLSQMEVYEGDGKMRISRMERINESWVEEELEEGSAMSSTHPPWVLVGLGLGLGLLLLLLLLLLILLGFWARKRWMAAKMRMWTTVKMEVKT